MDKVDDSILNSDYALLSNHRCVVYILTDFSWNEKQSLMLKTEEIVQFGFSSSWNLSSRQFISFDL